tara:strand:+ start:108771 stop:110627 length:1857 start_codon:yes stop_codon:yes gene_type:complete
MTSNNDDLDNLHNLSSAYAFLEDNAFSLQKEDRIELYWVRIKKNISDLEELQKVKWEIHIFLFDIIGEQTFGPFYPDFDINKKDPDKKSIKEAQQAEFTKYLKTRAKQSKNPILKARYNHLLWNGPKGVKHRDYASIANENYLDTIKNYLEFSQSVPDETQYRIGQTFECLIALSAGLRPDLKPIKSLVQELLFKHDLAFYTKHGILEDMLKYPKLFKADDFINTLKIIETEVNQANKKSDFFEIANYYIPTAIRIAQKTNSDVRPWHNAKGQAYLNLASSEIEEERSWLKLDYYSRAISSFTEARNKALIKSTEALYSKLKPKVKLDSIKIDYDQEMLNKLKEHQQVIKKQVEGILNHDTDYIYRFISTGQMFPSYEQVLKASENKNNAFLNLVTTIYFDKNKNITSKIDEKDLAIYETYDQFIRMSVLPFLHFLLISGIGNGKLNYQNFLEFIATKSWIGKPHNNYDLGGEKNPTNWLALLGPAIYDFFNQSLAWTSSKYYEPNFILCIDSLTLKFEGLLRDLCNRLDIGTSQSRQKGMQEAYIHNVLENETIQKFFNNEDMLFFNYLFTKSNGLNLRNNVAHCFLNSEEYHPDKMFLLIAALLRLAKYDYQPHTK